MTLNIFLVGIGGMLGSILRFLAGHFINPVPASAFPYGTFTVNVVGGFLIGMVFGLSQRYEWMTPELRVFLAVGFCGGFTTFSAFAYENIVMLQEKDYLSFAVYSVLSFIACLAAPFVGLIITK
ncbi:MAG: fluoride efflux transporter CrcB [Pyrinomonadaceae bacterium]|nr:fluoride efflux transporter CrcB [Pyrinomonadaceae bacterium]